MLLQTNATITTSQISTAFAVYIGVPSTKDQIQQFGGVVRHKILCQPGTNIQNGDAVYIQSWGANSVEPAVAWTVYSADPAGSLGLECIRVFIGTSKNR